VLEETAMQAQYWVWAAALENLEEGALEEGSTDGGMGWD